jgi:ribonuclease I
MKPIKESADGECSVCAEGDQDFWSVYGIWPDHTRTCIGDYSSEKEAAAVLSLFQTS